MLDLDASDTPLSPSKTVLGNLTLEGDAQCNGPREPPPRLMPLPAHDPGSALSTPLADPRPPPAVGHRPLHDRTSFLCSQKNTDAVLHSPYSVGDVQTKNNLPFLEVNDLPTSPLTSTDQRGAMLAHTHDSPAGGHQSHKAAPNTFQQLTCWPKVHPYARQHVRECTTWGHFQPVRPPEPVPLQTRGTMSPGPNFQVDWTRPAPTSRSLHPKGGKPHP